MKNKCRALFRWIKRHPETALWRLFAALAVIFVITMLTLKGGVFAWLLGTSGTGIWKYETLKFIGLGMAGVVAVIGALAVNRRADAQIKAAKAQAESAAAQAENNKLVEKGHVQDRFKAATEHLGHERAGMRIAAYYEFYQLAQKNQDLRKIIFDMLCAHLRQITNASDYVGKGKPTEGVQTLLDLLFKSEDKSIFHGLRANLQRVYLVGANLDSAYLQGANFRHADLRRVSMESAKLQRADFSDAVMHDACLEYAEMQCVEMQSVRFYNARLKHAQMQMANLTRAKLYGAILLKAELQCADLWAACLTGAQLNETQLQGANVGASSQFLGVSSDKSYTSSFESNIRKKVGRQGDINGCVFNGGMTSENLTRTLKSMDTDWIKRETADSFKLAMEDHSGSPQYGLDSTCSKAPVLDAYDKSKSDQLINQYNEEMKDIENRQ